MITAPDFKKKQIAFVLFNEGEKLALNNDNFTVKTEDGKIKFQEKTKQGFFLIHMGEELPKANSALSES